jgi:hypothetical protein
MAILRGLSSRLLPCGCLAGVYETYDGAIVTILDARAATCADPTHVDGKTIPLELEDLRASDRRRAER